jgi:peptidylamidoglycolate lyase
VIIRALKSYSTVFSILILLGCVGCGEGDNAEPLERSDSDSGFRVHHNWPSLPDGSTLGAVTAVDLDSHGHVFTFHGFREWVIPFLDQPESEPLILMWNGEDGTLISNWGAGIFRMPHGLSIDVEDNVWVTDVGRNQVLKFSHDGKLLMALGEDGVEGWDNTHFAQPTDVEFGLDGSVYVSDGYVNCRVIRFTPEGEYQFEWGECGDDPGQFNTPHDLAIDRQGKVYVADRENDRIQVFEADGEFIAAWHSDGKWRPYGLSISPTKEELFVVDGGEQPSNFPDRSGVVVLDLSGHQVDKFGRFGNQDGQFMMGHDITVSQEGVVYVVDVMGRRLQRFSQSKNFGETTSSAVP